MGVHINSKAAFTGVSSCILWVEMINRTKMTLLIHGIIEQRCETRWFICLAYNIKMLLLLLFWCEHIWLLIELVCILVLFTALLSNKIIQIYWPWLLLLKQNCQAWRLTGQNQRCYISIQPLIFCTHVVLFRVTERTEASSSCQPVRGRYVQMNSSSQVLYVWSALLCYQ